jgi:signal transduction histidine kinase
MAMILVVDDHLTNRDLLVTLLGYRGHCLLEAADGAEALEVARGKRPDLIVEEYCRGAREIIGAKWAALSLVNGNNAILQRLFIKGLDRRAARSLGASWTAQGIFQTLLKERQPYRLQHESGQPHLLGLPSELPPVYSFLGVPIGYQRRVYGWLGLVNKIGYDALSEADERRSVTLAAQMEMAHESARLFSSVQGQVAELAQEVAERKRAADEVRSLNVDLEQRVRERTAEFEAANRELEAFSDSVACNLRAPLRTIEGFAALLVAEQADRLDVEGQQYLQCVCASAQHMSQLTDALLELSRVTRHGIHRETIELTALAQDITIELRLSPLKRRVEFQIIPGLTGCGDAHLLQIVLDDLLGNAWKFTSKRLDAIIELGVVEGAGSAPL